MYLHKPRPIEDIMGLRLPVSDKSCEGCTLKVWGMHMYMSILTAAKRTASRTVLQLQVTGVLFTFSQRFGSWAIIAFLQVS